MQTGVKLLGHPVHPMLIPFPLGLLPTAVVFDIIHFATDNPIWATVSYWMIAAGIIGGLTAAVFGLLDWLAIPQRTRAKRIGAYHGIINVLVVTLFSASWVMRYLEGALPSPAAFALAIGGVFLALISGWLGGELVDRLGVGVDEGANVNAPSSLSQPGGGPMIHPTPHPAIRR
jgi:uncharacterized membrane protein